eukprot:COSAG01_NODE_7821_length_3042_cov_2.604145_1_plen_117_part_00
MNIMHWEGLATPANGQQTIVLTKERRGADLHTARDRCALIFRDKNRRFLGKSQSKMPHKRAQPPPHRRSSSRPIQPTPFQPAMRQTPSGTIHAMMHSTLHSHLPFHRHPLCSPTRP